MMMLWQRLPCPHTCNLLPGIICVWEFSIPLMKTWMWVWQRKHTGKTWKLQILWESKLHAEESTLCDYSLTLSLSFSLLCTQINTHTHRGSHTSHAHMHACYCHNIFTELTTKTIKWKDCGRGSWTWRLDSSTYSQSDWKHPSASSAHCRNESGLGMRTRYWLLPIQCPPNIPAAHLKLESIHNWETNKLFSQLQ